MLLISTGIFQYPTASAEETEPMKKNKTPKKKRMSMFLFQELLCHHINVEWLKTCGCLTGTTKR